MLLEDWHNGKQVCRERDEDCKQVKKRVWIGRSKMNGRGRVSGAVLQSKQSQFSLLQ